MSYATEQIERILDIMARLRGPDGCPWDKSQSAASLRPYLIEEAFEVLGELDKIADGASDSDTALCEELGDLLFQIVFHARLAEEKGAFGFADVARAIGDKIVRRHPQVFGDAPPCESDEALARQWAAIKAAERRDRTGRPSSALDGVPFAAPALMRAERLTEKASRVGFDWSGTAEVRAKLDEEVAELDEAIASGDREAIEAELGDVLFTAVNLARFVEVHPEDALRGAIGRFEARFRHVEDALAKEGKRPVDVDLATLEALWQQAKRAMRATEAGKGDKAPTTDPKSSI